MRWLLVIGVLVLLTVITIVAVKHRCKPHIVYNPLPLLFLPEAAEETAHPPVQVRVMVRATMEAPDVIVSGLIKQIFLVSNMQYEIPLLPTTKNQSMQPAYAIDTALDNWLLRQASEPVPCGFLVKSVRVQWIYMDVQEQQEMTRVMHEDYVIDPMSAGNVLHRVDDSYWQTVGKWIVKATVYPLPSVISVPPNCEGFYLAFNWTQTAQRVPTATVSLDFTT
jgi:hypothetical protein